MVSLRLYAAVSALALASTIGYAQQTRVQFYPTIIYLVSSKVSLMILGNAAMVCTVYLGIFAKSIFLGRLRPGEFYEMMDRARYTIIETCLTLIIFRDEINVKTTGLFAALLFSKIFHWLAAARLEHIEQLQITDWCPHVRVVSLLFCLLLSDVLFLRSAVGQSFKDDAFVPSVLIYFGFEATILATAVVSSSFKYVIHIVDTVCMAGQWHNKSTAKFYLELAVNATRSILYVVFFMIIFVYYGLPIHLIRDLWVSLKNLVREWRQFRRYRKLCANMDQRFPNATAEQLEEEPDCIVCREPMRPDEHAKVLPCGHIFHFYCLRSWLERSHTCPYCRAVVPEDPPATIAAPARPPVVPMPPAAAAAAAVERRRDLDDEETTRGDRSPATNRERATAAIATPASTSDGRQRRSGGLTSPSISSPLSSLPPLPLAPPLTPLAEGIASPAFTPVERQLEAMRTQMSDMQKQIAMLLELNRGREAELAPATSESASGRSEIDDDATNQLRRRRLQFFERARQQRRAAGSEDGGEGVSSTASA